MNKSTTSRTGDGGDESVTRSGDRPKTTDGGSPTVSNRGDDQKTLIDKWGQRVVHLLLVIVPGVLVAGVALQGSGVHTSPMRVAMAVVGLVFTIVGVLAIGAVVYDLIRKSRQTELSEFDTYK